MAKGGGAIGELVVKFTADIADILTNTERVKKELEGLHSSVTQQIEGLKSTFKTLTTAFGVYELLKHTIVSSVEAFAEVEAAQIRLQATLDATGNKAQTSVARIKNFADELAASTTYSDDQIINAAANLAKYTQIQGDSFERTIRDAANLAAITGGPLSEAANTLGRAMENAFAATRLRRVGLLTDAEVELQKALHEAGLEAERQEALLTAIEARSAGAAQAVGSQGLTSAFTQFGNAVNNAQEEIGEYISKAAHVEEVTRAITHAIRELIESGDLGKWALQAALGFTIIKEAFVALGNGAAALIATFIALVDTFVILGKSAQGGAEQIAGALLIMGGNILTGQELIRHGSDLINTIPKDFEKLTADLKVVGVAWDGFWNDRYDAESESIKKQLAELDKAGPEYAAKAKALALAVNQPATNAAGFTATQQSIASIVSSLDDVAPVANEAAESLGEAGVNAISIGEAVGGVRNLGTALADAKGPADSLAEAMNKIHEEEIKADAAAIKLAAGGVKALDEFQKKGKGLAGTVGELTAAFGNSENAAKVLQKRADELGISVASLIKKIASVQAAPEIASGFAQQLKAMEDAHRRTLTNIDAEATRRQADLDSQLKEVQFLRDAKIIGEEEFIRRKSELTIAGAQRAYDVELAKQQDLIKKVADLQAAASRAPDKDKRADILSQVKAAQDAVTKSTADLYAKQVQLGDATAEWGRNATISAQKVAEEMRKIGDQFNQTISGLEEMAAQQQRLTSYIGLSREQVAGLSAEYEVTKKIQDTLLELEKRYVEAVGQGRTLENALKPDQANQLKEYILTLEKIAPAYSNAARAAAEFNARATEALNNQITAWQSVLNEAETVFNNILDGGKNTFQQLADYIKTTVRKALFDLVAKQFIVPIITQISGGAVAGGINDRLNQSLAQNPAARALNIAPTEVDIKNLGTAAGNAAAQLGVFAGQLPGALAALTAPGQQLATSVNAAQGTFERMASDTTSLAASTRSIIADASSATTTSIAELSSSVGSFTGALSTQVASIGPAISSATTAVSGTVADSVTRAAANAFSGARLDEQLIKRVDVVMNRSEYDRIAKEITDGSEYNVDVQLAGADAAAARIAALKPPTELVSNVDVAVNRGAYDAFLTEVAKPRTTAVVLDGKAEFDELAAKVASGDEYNVAVQLAGANRLEELMEEARRESSLRVGVELTGKEAFEQLIAQVQGGAEFNVDVTGLEDAQTGLASLRGGSDFPVTVETRGLTDAQAGLDSLRGGTAFEIAVEVDGVAVAKEQLDGLRGGSDFAVAVSTNGLADAQAGLNSLRGGTAFNVAVTTSGLADAQAGLDGLREGGGSDFEVDVGVEGLAAATAGLDSLRGGTAFNVAVATTGLTDAKAGLDSLRGGSSFPVAVTTSGLTEAQAGLASLSGGATFGVTVGVTGAEAAKSELGALTQGGDFNVAIGLDGFEAAKQALDSLVVTRTVEIEAHVSESTTNLLGSIGGASGLGDLSRAASVAAGAVQTFALRLPGALTEAVNNVVPSDDIAAAFSSAAGDAQSTFTRLASEASEVSSSTRAIVSEAAASASELSNVVSSTANTLGAQLSEIGGSISSVTAAVTAATSAAENVSRSTEETFSRLATTAEGVMSSVAADVRTLALAVLDGAQRAFASAGSGSGTGLTGTIADSTRNILSDIASDNLAVTQNIAGEISESTNNIIGNTSTFFQDTTDTMSDGVSRLVGSTQSLFQGLTGSTLTLFAGLARSLGGAGGGVGGAAQSLLGGSGGLGQIGNLLGGSSGGLAAGIGSLLFEAGSAGAIASAAGVSAGISTLGIAATAGTAAIGGTAAAMGAMVAVAIPVVGWIAAIGFALYSAFGQKGGGPKSGGFAQTSNFGAGERFFTPSDGDDNANKVVKGLSSSIYDAVGQLGGHIKDLGVAFGYDVDKIGDAQSRVSAGVSIGGQNVFNQRDVEVGRSDAELQAGIETESARAVLAAVQNSNLPTYLTGLLNTVIAETASKEDVTGILDTAKAAKTLVEVLSKALSPEQVERFNASLEAIDFSKVTEPLKAVVEAGFAELAPALTPVLEAFQGTGEELTKFAGTLVGIAVISKNFSEEFKKNITDALSDATQETADKVAAFVTIFANFGTAITGLGPALEGLDPESITAFIDALGGAAKAVEKISFLYTNFTTSAQKLSDNTALLTKDFNELGITTIPQTHEQFLALLSSFDLTTEAGRTMYNAVAALAPLFVEVAGTADQVAQALENQAAKGRDLYTQHFLTPDEQRAQQQVIDSTALHELTKEGTLANTVLRDLGFNAIPLTVAGVRKLITATIAKYGAESDEAKAIYACIPAIDSLINSVDGFATAANNAVVSVGSVIKQAGELASTLLSQFSNLAGQSTGSFGDKLAIQVGLIEDAISSADRGDFTSGTAFNAYIGKLRTQGQSLADQLARFTVLSADYGDATAEQLVGLETWYNEQFRIFGGNTAFNQNAAALDALKVIFDQKWAKIIAGTTDAGTGVGNALEGIIKQIREFIANLLTSDLSILTPIEKLSVAQQAFAAQLALAQSGNQDALQNITKYANDYLTQARDVYASSTAYADIFNSVVDALNHLADTATITTTTITDAANGAAGAGTPTPPANPAPPSLPQTPQDAANSLQDFYDGFIPNTSGANAAAQQAAAAAAAAAAASTTTATSLTALSAPMDDVETASTSLTESLQGVVSGLAGATTDAADAAAPLVASVDATAKTLTSLYSSTTDAAKSAALLDGALSASKASYDDSAAAATDAAKQAAEIPDALSKLSSVPVEDLKAAMEKLAAPSGDAATGADALADAVAALLGIFSASATAVATGADSTVEPLTATGDALEALRVAALATITAADPASLEAMADALALLGPAAADGLGQLSGTPAVLDDLAASSTTAQTSATGLETWLTNFARLSAASSTQLNADAAAAVSLSQQRTIANSVLDPNALQPLQPPTALGQVQPTDVLQLRDAIVAKLSESTRIIAESVLAGAQQARADAQRELEAERITAAMIIEGFQTAKQPK